MKTEGAYSILKKGLWTDRRTTQHHISSADYVSGAKNGKKLIIWHFLFWSILLSILVTHPCCNRCSGSIHTRTSVAARLTKNISLLVLFLSENSTLYIFYYTFHLALLQTPAKNKNLPKAPLHLELNYLVNSYFPRLRWLSNSRRYLQGYFSPMIHFKVVLLYISLCFFFNYRSSLS